MESSQDKSLPATERKIQKTREDGQTSRSRDLSHLAVIGVGGSVLLIAGPTLMEYLRRAVAQHLTFSPSAVRDPTLMLERLGDMLLLGFVSVVLFAVVVNIASIIFTLMSGGWIYSLKPIMPQFSRINPLSGVKNVFSKQQLITAAKNVLLTLILATIAWFHISGGLNHIAKLPAQPTPLSLSVAADWVLTGIALLVLVVFIVAMIDVPLQKILFLQRLKMTHQEVKQEHKESEGSPELKGRIRQKQREAAHRASITRVPAADMVVMNPTHYAVALRYDDQTMDAPQVIAKGADLIALRIRDVAREHKVPVLQAPMLARALYAHAELDQTIPSTLYTAVAQVLAYVYRLKASMRGEAPDPGELVQPHIPPELDPHHKPTPAARAHQATSQTSTPPPESAPKPGQPKQPGPQGPQQP